MNTASGWDFEGYGDAAFSQNQIRPYCLIKFDNMLFVFSQNEFNMYIKPRRLQDSSFCELLLKEKLSSLVPTSHERFHLSSTCFLKYTRYGKLLGYSDIHLYLNLADTCLTKGQIQEAKKYFKLVKLLFLLKQMIDRSIMEFFEY